MNHFEHVDSREAIQKIIKDLSLRECPPNIEKVLFNVDLTPIQTNGMSLLKYQPNTDQIFGLGQELDSIEKWNEYASNMKALKRLKSMAYRGPEEHLERVLEKFETTSVTSNDLLLLIQKIRRLWEEPQLVNGYFRDPDLVQYMELDEFLEECDLR